MVCCHGHAWQAQRSTLPHACIHQHQRHAGCFINSRVYYAYCPCVCPTLACAGVLPLSLRQDPGGASRGTAARWRRYRQQPQQRASSSTGGSSRVRPWPLCVQRQRQQQQIRQLLTSCSPVTSADPHTVYRLPSLESYTHTLPPHKSLPNAARKCRLPDAPAAPSGAGGCPSRRGQQPRGLPSAPGAAALPPAPVPRVHPGIRQAVQGAQGVGECGGGRGSVEVAGEVWRRQGCGAGKCGSVGRSGANARESPPRWAVLESIEAGAAAWARC